MMDFIFSSKELILPTKHGKSLAIAPVFAGAFGMYVSELNIDTDVFGTFSGEIERISDPLQAAKSKIAAAQNQNPQATIFIASEGSFFPHPENPFVTVNHELLLLVDTINALEISVQQLFRETNFSRFSGDSFEDLSNWLRAIDFPSHAVILKKEGQFHKGIHSKETLLELIGNAPIHSLHLETDMRAHCNPTRMKNIGLLAEKLAKAVKSTCPTCQKPGFQVVKQVEGLPCMWCQTPTHLIHYSLKSCSNCGYEEQEKRADNLTAADPMYCSMCNP